MSRKQRGCVEMDNNDLHLDPCFFGVSDIVLFESSSSTDTDHLFFSGTSDSRVETEETIEI